MKHNIKALGIIPLLIFCICANTAVAQKKSETKLYKNVLAKGDTLSFNKFLAKFPNSVYAKEIHAKKDSLIKSYNTSSLSIEEAVAIAGSNLPQLQQMHYGKDFILLPGKKDNVEHIVIVTAPSEDNPNFKIIKIEEGKSDGGWNMVLDKSETPYRYQGEHLSKFRFLGAENLFDKATAKEVVIKGEKFLLFNYMNYTEGTDERSKWENNDCDIVANLISMNDGAIFNSVFAGEKSGEEIFGKCPEASQGGLMAVPQTNFLVTYFTTLPNLKPMEKEKELTKEAIKWWYEHNPKGSKTLDFGVLDKEHPIVKKFIATKTKEVSANNSADFFDIMETTVLCVYNKANSQYMLVWCEPQPKNPKTEKALSTIYFEKGNTLVLYYYHGNKTFKERINLGTRQKR